MKQVKVEWQKLDERLNSSYPDIMQYAIIILH